MDKRWDQLANLLVDYSMGVQAGEKVMIAYGEKDTYPLVYSLYRECIKRGAYPQVQFLSEELNRILLKYGNEAQIDWLPELEAYGMEWADVYFGLRGAYNLSVFWDIPTERVARLRKTMGKISTLRWQKTRWCLLRVPNAALAQQAGVDEETITDIFFDACLLDWENESREWKRWAEILGKGSHLRITGKGTDLEFSVEGRTWEVANGHTNMPDGEIATSPVEQTVHGVITFESAGILGGQLINDICLRWEFGNLVEATSSINQDYLHSILNTDEGASRIGEFAIGTNPHLALFCKDILLDEKIGGTIHIAMGRAYPQTGGTNQSAIHWDIVKDMREEGQIFLDGKKIYERGIFLG